jgi:hypothetical protein
LDFLGFPWILSSESRLFNGLQAKSARKYFLALSPGVSAAGVGARAGLADAEGQDWSLGEGNLVSDFLQ